MADVKVTLKRVIDAQGNTDNIHPTTDWDQVENKPSTFTPTAHSLNTHTDVDANPTANGQVLTWDADNSQWIASTTAGGGVSKSDLQNVYIYGKADGAITIGQAVQFAGVEGDHILIKPAVPSEINAEPTLMIGIAETTLANNEFGYVIVNGRLNLDTSTYTAGDLLYFASAGSTAGALTTTEPTDPNASIQMAAVSIDGVGNGEFIIRNTILTRQINEVIGLQGALDSKVNKSGDTMSGDLNIIGANKSFIVGEDANNVVQLQWNDSGNLGKLLTREAGTYYDNTLVLKTGNVGIGTTSPASPLEVYHPTTNRVALFRSGDSDVGISLQDNSTSGSTTVQIGASGNDLYLRAGGSEKVRIKSDGNVGIGTTSPLHKLEVGDLVSDSTLGTVGIKTDANNYAILIEETGTGQESWGLGVDTAGNLNFYNSGSTTPSVRFMDSGNVGIGTTDPERKLHILSDIEEALRLDVTTNTGGIHFRENGTFKGLFGFSNGTTMYTGADADDMVWRSEGKAHIVSNTNQNGITVSGGNVGIGTTSPGKKLHIVGDARVEGDLTVNGTMTVVDTDVNTTEQWIITNDGTGPAAIINQTGAQPVIDIQDDGTSAFYIEDGGNVGIGTTDPSQKLEVKGNLVLDGADAANFLYGYYNKASFPTYSYSILQTGAGDALTGTRGLIINEGHGQTVSNYGITLATNDTSRLFINTSGNVGIGTTSPSSPLHIAGSGLNVNGAGTGVHLGMHLDTWSAIELVSNANNSGWIDFREENEDYSERIRGGIGELEFYASGSEKAKVTSSGFSVLDQVEIGEYSAVSRSAGLIKINSASGSGWDGQSGAALGKIQFFSGDTSSNGPREIGSIELINTGGNYYLPTPDMLFKTGITSSDERMRITSGGNIGIGDSTPSYKLELLDSTNDWATKITNDSTENISVYFAHGSGYGMAIDSTENDGKYIFKAMAGTGAGGGKGTVPVIWAQHNGYVGINTSLPSFSLDVSGDIHSSGSAIFEGNVGIGTTSAAYPLTVDGEARFSGPVNVETNSTADRAFYVSRAGTGQALRFYTTDNVSYIDTIQDENTGIYGSLAISADMEAPDSYISLTGNTLRLNGDVGIGTSSPVSLLEVKAPNGSTGTITVGGGNTGVTAVGEINAALDFRSNDASVNNTNNIAGRIASVTEFSNGAYTGLAFYTFKQARTPDLQEAMRINYEGNVGIGTTSPGYKLQVNGTFNATNPMINSESGSNNASVMQWRYATTDAYRLRLKQTVTSGVVRWNFSQTNNNTDYNDVLVLDRGNVGIGTTSPSSKLFVNGNTIVQSAGDALVVKGTTTGGVNINPWGTNTNIDPNDANGTIYFGRDSALANFIVQSGNVGIGTTSPSHKLNIYNGTANFSLGYDSSGNYPTLYADSVLRIAQRTQIFGGSGGYYLDVRNSSGNQNALIGGEGHNTFFAALNGNVGIGTISPSTILSVNQPSADINNGLWVYAGNNPSDGGVAIYKSASKVASIASLGGSSSLTFVTNASGTNYERMRITDTGKFVFQPNFLSTDGNTKTNLINILVGSTSDGSANGIKFYENVGGFGMSFGYDGTGSGTGNKLAWYNNANAQIMELMNEVSNNALKVNGNIVWNAGNLSKSLTYTLLGSINLTTGTDTLNISPSNGLNSVIVIEAELFANGSPATWTGPLSEVGTNSTYKSSIYNGSTRFTDYYRNSAGTQIYFSGTTSNNVYRARVYELKVA